jgi:Lhr-like helicase
MLKTILSISGKPGLYKLISQGKNMLIVEAVSTEKKRFPAYTHEKITALSDIAIYIENGEVPLKEVLTSIKEKENGAAIPFDIKKATPDELGTYMREVLPNFDKERVRISDIKKLFAWYNILIANGITDFKTEKTEE